MQEKVLIRIAIIWSLIGLFLLLLLASYSEPKELKIIQLGDNIGKTVSISGEITSISFKESVNFIKLEDSSAEILVVAFGELDQRLNKRDVVSIIGKVEIYQSELEVIAQNIECIKCMN